ncbi:MAG: hypothetical protein JNK77_02880 [Saprospiraceae bacterium]|nr:hypothetical protein [Saprospiraceae bacterium]
MPSNEKSRGILYITVGAAYTRQAIQSAESVKKHAPGLAVCLFTDQVDIKHPAIDKAGLIENPHNRSKIDYIHQTPFEQTLYLDADTRVVADISHLFDILERFDLGIAHAHQRNHFPTNQPWRIPIPAGFPQMNGGVLLFKNNAPTIRLLKEWQAAYHANSFAKDQVTLRELLWLSDLRIAILPPEYNIRYEKYLDVWTDTEALPHILHFPIFKEKDNFVNQKNLTFKAKLQWRWQKIKWIWKQIKSLG